MKSISVRVFSHFVLDQYISRIEYVAATKPELLIAYTQTMFLAALAGGQILGAIVKRTLGNGLWRAGRSG